jgi:succinyl-CoA synthetase beta subunit
VVKSQIHAGGRGKGKFIEAEAGEKGGVRLGFSKEQALEHVKAMLGNTWSPPRPARRQAGQPHLHRRRRRHREANSTSRCWSIAAPARSPSSSRPKAAWTSRPSPTTRPRKSDHPDRPATGVTDADAAKLNDALKLSGEAAQRHDRPLPILYKAFVEKDMAMLEINPLIVMKNGHLRVLDAKVSFDGNACSAIRTSSRCATRPKKTPKRSRPRKWDLAYIALDGTIGCMVNGAGLAMATMDIIKLYGEEPANFCDVGGGAGKEKVAAAFKIIMKDPKVKGILVNIFGGIMKCDVIAEGVLAAVRETNLWRCRWLSVWKAPMPNSARRSSRTQAST